MRERERERCNTSDFTRRSEGVEGERERVAPRERQRETKNKRERVRYNTSKRDARRV